MLRNENLNGMQDAELTTFLADAQCIADDARAAFGNLSAAQINWKPSAKEWSVGQCFEHLILTNAGYFPALERLARGEKRRTMWERMPILPRVFGSLVLKAVDPNSTRKIKAPNAFQPASSEIEADIIEKFAAHQNELIRLAQTIDGVDLRKTVITSPISPLVTCRLVDACRIIIAHERRHFAQARRVTETENFPRA
jgi:hypothetical protein